MPSMPLLLLRPWFSSDSPWVPLRPTEIGGKSRNDEAKDEASGVSPGGRVDDTDSLEEDGRSEDDVERCIPASGDDEDEPEGATEEPKRRRVVSEPALWGDPAAASAREAPLVKASAAAIEPDEAATASSRASDAMSSSPILEASLCVQVR